MMRRKKDKKEERDTLTQRNRDTVKQTKRDRDREKQREKEREEGTTTDTCSPVAKAQDVANH